MRSAWTRVSATAGLPPSESAAVLAVLGYRDLLSWWWTALPVAGFVALLVWHDRVIRAGQAFARAIAFYERGIARLEDRWIDSSAKPGQDSQLYGSRFLDDDHLYARDLDIFGHGSLFQLLSLARTHAGEDTLASWLKAPAARRICGDGRKPWRSFATVWISVKRSRRWAGSRATSIRCPSHRGGVPVRSP